MTESTIPPEDGGFSSNVVNAGAWAFAMRISVRVLQLGRTFILAKLLSPEDFGLMGFAIISLLTLNMLSRTGFWEALVQYKGDIEDRLDTAWTIEAIRGTLIGAVVFGAAPFIAGFFGDPNATEILRVMALSPVLIGFTNLAIARFDRALNFRKVFAFEISQAVAEVAAAIIAALVLRSVWALVIGVIAGSAARVIASFALAPRRPRFVIEREKAIAMFRYGRWIFGSFVLWLLTNEIDDILVGRLLGAGALGLYRMAYTLSQSMVTEIAQTINQVVFPAFSQMQDDRRRLAEGYRQAVHLVSFLAFPAALGLVILGQDMTRVLLNDDWLPMVPALQVLSIAGAIRAVSTITGIMFEGAGSPQTTTRFQTYRLVGLLLTIYPAINRFGLEGAAWATVIATLVGDVPMLVHAGRFLEVPRLSLLRGVALPLLNATVMAGVVWLTSSLFGDTFGAATLIGLIVVGALAYFAGALVGSRFLGYSEISEVVTRVRARSGRRDE
jgi:O-antigen/teichoic acid export membrane protein